MVPKRLSESHSSPARSFRRRRRRRPLAGGPTSTVRRSAQSRAPDPSSAASIRRDGDRPEENDELARRSTRPPSHPACSSGAEHRYPFLMDRTSDVTRRNDVRCSDRRARPGLSHDADQEEPHVRFVASRFAGPPGSELTCRGSTVQSRRPRLSALRMMSITNRDDGQQATTPTNVTGSTATALGARPVDRLASTAAPAIRPKAAADRRDGSCLRTSRPEVTSSFWPGRADQALDGLDDPQRADLELLHLIEDGLRVELADHLLEHAAHQDGPGDVEGSSSGSARRSPAASAQRLAGQRQRRRQRHPVAERDLGHLLQNRPRWISASDAVR